MSHELEHAAQPLVPVMMVHWGTAQCVDRYADRGSCYNNDGSPEWILEARN